MLTKRHNPCCFIRPLSVNLENVFDILAEQVQPSRWCSCLWDG